METKTLYVCRHCGKQMLELDENRLFKVAINLMFTGYLEYGTFILQGTCKECAAKQQIIFCANMASAA